MDGAHVGQVLLLAHIDRQVARAWRSRRPPCPRRLPRPARRTACRALRRSSGHKVVVTPASQATSEPLRAPAIAPSHRQIAVEQGVHHAHAARGGQELVAKAQQAARGHQVGQVHAAIAGVSPCPASGRAALPSISTTTPTVSGWSRCALLQTAPASRRPRPAGRSLPGARPGTHSLRGAWSRSGSPGAARRGPRRGRYRRCRFRPRAGRRCVRSSSNRRSRSLREVPQRALPPGKGRGVDAKGHAHGRLFHLDGRQRDRVLRVGQGLADGNPLQPGQGDDLAGLGLPPLRPAPAPGARTGSAPARAAPRPSRVMRASGLPGLHASRRRCARRRSRRGNRRSPGW